MNGLSCGEKAWQYVQPFWYSTSVWQTDRRTDVQPIFITCFSIADARKNAMRWNKTKNVAQPGGVSLHQDVVDCERVNNCVWTCSLQTEETWARRSVGRKRTPLQRSCKVALTIQWKPTFGRSASSCIFLLPARCRSTKPRFVLRLYVGISTNIDCEGSIRWLWPWPFDLQNSVTFVSWGTFPQNLKFLWVIGNDIP